MKPIILHGHERAVTQVKYNREGDLLFSVAKDHHPNVWYALNGERLGTFEGHTGAVWCVDVSWDSTKVVTGAADNSCRVWDCETGKQLGKIDTSTAVRTCGFSYSGQQLMFTTDKQMGYGCKILFYDVRDPAQMKTGDPATLVEVDRPKITSALWGQLDDYIITGHEDGAMCQWDPKSGEQLVCLKEHSKQINDIQQYKDGTMLVTASKDCTAKLFDSGTLRHMKTYKTERPINSASISPLRDHVVVGGGQEAMEVTTTSTRIGKFDARFFHLIFEEEFGRVKGHFGPINSVVFSPDGKSYSSGGEDGYVRVHHFDAHYFDFEVEY